MRDGRSDLDVAEEAKARPRGGLLERARDGLDVLVVGRDAEADEPPRRRQPVDHVDLDRRLLALQQRVGGVEAGRAGADDGDAERFAHVASLTPAAGVTSRTTNLAVGTPERGGDDDQRGEHRLHAAGASLVMLMTPGLAFFYGGLVGRSNTLTIMIQSFASMGITTGCGGSSATRCASAAARTGSTATSIYAFLRHVGANTMYKPSGIPLTVLIAYQMMFAIITPALITGAFTNRVTFKAYLIFLVVWQLAVYYPFVHMFWGDGLLAQWGAATSRAASWCTPAPAGLRSLGALRRQAQVRRHAAQHPVHRARHRPALVRLVRLQRRQRAEGRQHHRARVPEHRPRRVVRSHHVAVHRMVEREEAALRRPAHRRRRRPRDDHAGGRLRPDLRVGRDRHRRRSRLLLRGPAEEPAETGTTRSTSGASTAWAACSASSCSASSPARRSTRPAARPDPRQRGRSSASSSPPVLGCSLYAFVFTYAMLNADRPASPRCASARKPSAASTRRCTARTRTRSRREAPLRRRSECADERRGEQRAADHVGRDVIADRDERARDADSPDDRGRRCAAPRPGEDRRR